MCERVLCDWLYGGSWQPRSLERLVLACLSSGFRSVLLECGGLRLGPFTFSRDSTTQTLSVRLGMTQPPSTLEVPPVGWWAVTGNVELCCDYPEWLPVLAEFVRLVQRDWPRALITTVSISGKAKWVRGARKDPEQTIAEATESILKDVSPTLERVSLRDFHALGLEEETLPPAPRLHVVQVHGSVDHRRLGSWLQGSPVEELKLEGSLCLSPKMLGELTAGNGVHQQLKKLLLEGFALPHGCVEAVHTPQAVLELNLKQCRDLDALDLSRFMRLQNLILCSTRIAFGRVKGLLKCGDLRSINVDDSGAVADLNLLAGLHMLEELSACRTNLTNDGIRQLNKCVYLKHLNLSGCRQITDVNVLGDLRRLKKLYLRETGVEDEGIVRLRNCVSLEILDLGSCIQLANVDVLGNLPELKELRLQFTGLQAEDLLVLCNYLSLEILDLSGCFALIDVNTLGNLTRLKELNLQFTGVQNEGLLGLRECVSLEVLDLSWCRQITDVNVLGKLTRLRELYLQETGLRDRGIVELRGCLSLKVLDLRGCNELRDLSALHELLSLKILD